MVGVGVQPLCYRDPSVLMCLPRLSIRPWFSSLFLNCMMQEWSVSQVPSTTIVSGSQVMAFFLQHILARKPKTTHKHLNEWMKALVHLQKAQGMALYKDGTSFGAEHHIRQFMPLMGLLANTSTRDFQRSTAATIDHKRINSGYDLTQYNNMGDFMLKVGAHDG